MNLNQPALSELWEKSRIELGAQFEQRPASAVFLEGSIAEGFGNERSDVDFVALFDDPLELPTMPYILFIDGRRVEVRLLSSARLRGELARVRSAANRGLRGLSRLSWNLLERCQRFMGCVPIRNESLIRDLQAELGQPTTGAAVSGWFSDFARQTGRYAVAMFALEQPDHARAWIRTAVFHAAKSHVAALGEKYMGPKWLSLQLERARIDRALVDRLWAFLQGSLQVLEAREALETGIALIRDFGVSGVSLDPEKVLIVRVRGVTTWQVGDRVHLLRASDLYALDEAAAKVWRRIVWNLPCIDIARKSAADCGSRGLDILADFSRSGLIGLRWKGSGEIRARQHATTVPAGREPLISIDGARLEHRGRTGIHLLPLPARRFAEAGLELAWAQIGLENAREDAEGAFKGGQWRVLAYSLERMVQVTCLAALSSHGVTPQPPLEEAVLEAIRLLEPDEALVEDMRRVERGTIASKIQAQAQIELAEGIVARLRAVAGEADFPASFDSADGWLQTILKSYDWVNLAAHLNARFPQTAHGGRGSAEEARDLLASYCA